MININLNDIKHISDATARLQRPDVARYNARMSEILTVGFASGIPGARRTSEFLHTH